MLSLYAHHGSVDEEGLGDAMEVMHTFPSLSHVRASVRQSLNNIACFWRQGRVNNHSHSCTTSATTKQLHDRRQCARTCINMFLKPNRISLAAKRLGENLLSSVERCVRILVVYGKFYYLCCTTQARIYQQCGSNTRVNHSYVTRFRSFHHRGICYDGREND